MTDATPLPQKPRRANQALALVRTLGIAGMTGVNFAQAMLEISLSADLKGRYAAGMRGTSIWARETLGMMGLRPRVSGPPPPRGALLVPNHLSYIDVAVIASAAPAFFVAKGEVERWPLIGPLLLKSGHMVINRSGGKGLIETARQIHERLGLGERVCVFMEGTTSGGDRILPFLPSMFKPALELGAPIVPVGVRWHAPGPGLSVSEDLAYWREAHTFVPHLWRLLGLPGFEGEVVFGEPMTFDRKTDRGRVGEIVRAEVMRLTGLPAGIKEE